MSATPLRAADHAATTTCERVRRDFPILSREIHGKPLVYLDSAASSQRPRAVIRARRSTTRRTCTPTCIAACTR